MKKLLPALLLILLSGCSHEDEVRNMSFVKTIGSDVSEDGSRTAVIQLYDSEDILTGNGKTIFSAVQNAETAQGKALFNGHTELFLAGEGAIEDSLTLLIKNNRISPSCTFVCTDESTEDIISEDTDAALSGLLDSSSRKGLILKRSISEALDDMLGEDGMAAVPMVNGGGLSMAIIDSEEIQGILTDDEAKGLCWLCESLHDLYLPVTASGTPTDFLVRKSSPGLKAAVNGEYIDITVEIKINGSVQNDSANRTEIRRQTADQISSLCAKAIAKTVTVYKADVFGLEKCIKSSGICKDQKWQDIIPRLRFYYNIKIAE